MLISIRSEQYHLLMKHENMLFFFFLLAASEGLDIPITGA